MRGIGDGISEGEDSIGGDDGAAQVGPVGAGQAVTGLQLIRPARLRAPSQIQRAVGEGHGLELWHTGEPESGAANASQLAKSYVPAGSRPIRIAVVALHNCASVWDPQCQYIATGHSISNRRGMSSFNLP